MALTAFVFFLLGIFAELVFLYESAHGRRIITTRPDESRDSLRAAIEGGHRPFVHSLLAAGDLRPARDLLAGAALLAALLAGVFEWAGIGAEKVSIDTPGVSLIFILLGLGLLAAALAANLFLPRVNEAVILVVQGTVLLGFLWTGEPVEWLPLVALGAAPALVTLALLACRLPLPPQAKALIYLWYLVTLLMGPFQSGQAALFQESEPSWTEAISLGMVFIFLLVHGLFAVRFFLIVSSMILPRNHCLVARLMLHLFADEQVSLPRFSLAAIVVAGLLFANRYLGIMPQPFAVSFGTLLGVHLMTRGASYSEQN
jgi:hypothetical protein